MGKNLSCLEDDEIVFRMVRAWYPSPIQTLPTRLYLIKSGGVLGGGGLLVAAGSVLLRRLHFTSGSSGLIHGLRRKSSAHE